MPDQPQPPAKRQRKHTKEFKEQAVALAARNGVAQTARDLGIGESLIYAWRQQLSRKGPAAFTAERNAVDAELARLRREVADLREERDILKKAATYFARERP